MLEIQSLLFSYASSRSTREYIYLSTQKPRVGIWQGPYEITFESKSAYFP